MESELVSEEVGRLENETDEEIMKQYVEQVLSIFPSTIIIDALEVVMKKRKLVPTDLAISLRYTNYTNEVKTIHIRNVSGL
jgi:hypothetical protein